MYLEPNYIYDNELSRPYNMSYSDLISNSVKLLFSFNETNSDPRKQIQKLEVCSRKSKIYFNISDLLGSLCRYTKLYRWFRHCTFYITSEFR